MCTLSISNVIYHKFSHGAAFCTLNGKNVNVMLELLLFLLDINIAVHLAVAINVLCGVSLYCPFSHEMSWMKSGT